MTPCSEFQVNQQERKLFVQQVYFSFYPQKVNIEGRTGFIQSTETLKFSQVLNDFRWNYCYSDRNTGQPRCIFSRVFLCGGTRNILQVPRSNLIPESKDISSSYNRGKTHVLYRFLFLIYYFPLLCVFLNGMYYTPLVYLIHLSVLNHELKFPNCKKACFTVETNFHVGYYFDVKAVFLFFFSFICPYFHTGLKVWKLLWCRLRWKAIKTHNIHF